MLILKHLKTLENVSIIIRIIFRELVGSLLKSLNLKMWKVNCGDAAASPQVTFHIFKFSDFNKEPMSSLRMIWRMIETCWSVFKCFNINNLD